MPLLTSPSLTPLDLTAPDTSSSGPGIQSQDINSCSTQYDLLFGPHTVSIIHTQGRAKETHCSGSAYSVYLFGCSI